MTLPYTILKVNPVANPQTFADIAQMHVDCFGNVDPILPPDVGEWWIAYQGLKPAGFCGLHLHKPERGTAKLVRAGVLKRHRGHGLQTRMIRTRLAFARSMGCKRAVSDAVNFNPESCNNLIRCGFRMFNPTEPWGLDRSCYWEKSL